MTNKPIKKVQEQMASTTTSTVATTKSVSDRIWEEIENLPIDMFALPSQIVSMHCSRVVLEPTKLYLTIRSSAVLPALELAIGSKFTVSQANKYIVVARA